MKTVQADELFQNLGEFLKTKGVELKDGTYTSRLRKGCGVLADLVNATQRTVRSARKKADRTLDQLRQTIHERTAPKPRGAETATEATAAPPPAPEGAVPPVMSTPAPTAGTPAPGRRRRAAKAKRPAASATRKARRPRR